MTRHFCIAAQYFFDYSESLAGLLVHLNISLHVSAEDWELRVQGFFFLASLTVAHSGEAFSFSGFSVYIGEQVGKRMGKRKLILD